MIDPAQMDALFTTYGERGLAWAKELGMADTVEQLQLHPEISNAIFKLLVLAWMCGAADECAQVNSQAGEAPRILLLN